MSQQYKKIIQNFTSIKKNQKLKVNNIKKIEKSKILKEFKKKFIINFKKAKKVDSFKKSKYPKISYIKQTKNKNLKSK